MESGSEGEVDTEVEGVVGVERDILFGELANSVVHTCEEVEAGHMKIDYPAEGGSKSTYRTVDAG